MSSILEKNAFFAKKMTRMKRKILIGMAVVLLGIQFLQIDKAPKPVNRDIDFVTIANPPKDVLHILDKACYDCHSHQTVYPWYASIQPIGWWLRGHTRGAKMNLNFSEFGLLEIADRNAVLREAAKEVEANEMPMKSYTNMHSEAKLTDAEKATLIEWLRNPLPADLSLWVD